MSIIKPKTSILDRNLSKGKGEVHVSSFALLFSEIVQYCQNRSYTVPELQNKLSDLGQQVGLRMLDLLFVREQSSKREIKIIKILLFVKQTVWKTLFGKEADKLEHSNDDERTYYLIEKDPFVNRFISVSMPKDKGTLNCAAFMAGIVEATLTGSGFPCKVTTHWHKGTTFMIKFEDSVIIRDKRIDSKLVPSSSQSIMSAGDWEEVKRLAADFQRAQLTSASQKLSERNCIEIVSKLLQLKLLDVFHTSDGKEYITPAQLGREIRDELFVHGGRMNLADLSQILRVDYPVVESKVQDLVSHDNSLYLVLGQLLNSDYLDRLTEEINDKLQQDGRISVSELTKIRGLLSAVTRPVPCSNLISYGGFPEHLFYSIAEELIHTKRIAGSISGGRQSAKSVFIPELHARSQNQWVTDFFRQNGYLEYDALRRLGITDAESYVKKTFGSTKEDMVFLPTVCCGPALLDQIEGMVEEALNTGSWIDVQVN
ncbi:unnamed protein product [Darwinula stevensoni]|uniref:E3 UFM1-protein ligase 1 homolog n=1 Tax=Darwinula stevensoni TaxID=69355 RepID=A0A7R8XE64_9CRUS|nr:unnamed protein product [Darwinula stevensoni]CAG0889263.1 unnamed protein product [Darwinula stevensoni]